MELRKVHIQAPVTLRDCHLRFSGDGGAEQLRRRAHLLQPTGKGKGASAIYHLEGSTMFKAGETIETDYAFPKGMRDKVDVEPVDHKKRDPDGKPDAVAA